TQVQPGGGAACSSSTSRRAASSAGEDGSSTTKGATLSRRFPWARSRRICSATRSSVKTKPSQNAAARLGRGRRWVQARSPAGERNRGSRSRLSAMADLVEQQRVHVVPGMAVLVAEHEVMVEQRRDDAPLLLGLQREVVLLGHPLEHRP